MNIQNREVPEKCTVAIKLGVVIPFFQRQSGLLRTAVESIVAQSVVASGECSIQVAIVDDSSPVSALQELEGYQAPAGVEIKVHRQPNGGAGAARNAAIDMLDASCEVVAFLDSDDAWAPNHLERALKGLAAGADFYFCNALRGEDEPSQNADAPEWFGNALVPIDGSADLFLYIGASDLAIVNGLVPTTSTIVHRCKGSGGPRFPSGYFRFGEDQCYCLRFLAGQGQVAYSAAVEVQCGRGVNIFAGNAPGSESARLCLMDEIAYRREALATLALSPLAEQHVRRKLVEARQALLRQGLWFARDGRFDWIMRSLSTQPGLFFHLPRAVWSVLLARSNRHARSIGDAKQSGE
jgi:succinoglycan biosynthesis protein ExoW